MNDICPSRDDAQPHIFKGGKCALCLASAPPPRGGHKIPRKGDRVRTARGAPGVVIEVSGNDWVSIRWDKDLEDGPNISQQPMCAFIDGLLEVVPLRELGKVDMGSTHETDDETEIPCPDGCRNRVLFYSGTLGGLYCPGCEKGWLDE